MQGNGGALAHARSGISRALWSRAEGVPHAAPPWWCAGSACRRSERPAHRRHRQRMGLLAHGQFAGDYKRLFGELPSETLRHSCGSASSGTLRPDRGKSRSRRSFRVPAAFPTRSAYGNRCIMCQRKSNRFGASCSSFPIPGVSSAYCTVARDRIAAPQQLAQTTSGMMVFVEPAVVAWFQGVPRFGSLRDASRPRRMRRRLVEVGEAAAARFRHEETR